MSGVSVSKARIAIAAAAVGLGLILGGCGSGQITQTDTQAAAVNGAMAEVGQVAVRDAQLAYPEGKQPVYKQGSDARLLVTIVNNGARDDQLLDVSSPLFSASKIDGNRSLPARTALRSGADPDDHKTQESSASAPASASSSAEASESASPESAESPAKPGEQNKVTIELTGLNKPALRPGITIPVQFKFANAGTGTVQVPIASPEAGADNG